MTEGMASLGEREEHDLVAESTYIKLVKEDGR